MRIQVEVRYENSTRNKKVTVEVKDGLKGKPLLNAIDRLIEKRMEGDKHWLGWVLV